MSIDFNSMLTDTKAERKLPTGVAEFDKLIEDLKTNYEMPTNDDESIRFALSSAIMHLGPLDSHKSLDFFYKTLVAAASKQIAGFVFHETKMKHNQRVADEQAAAAAKEVPNEPQG